MTQMMKEKFPRQALMTRGGPRPLSRGQPTRLARETLTVQDRSTAGAAGGGAGAWGGGGGGGVGGGSGWWW